MKSRSPWIHAATREEAELAFWELMERLSKGRRLSARERIRVLSVRRVYRCLTTWEVAYAHD